MAFKLVQMGSIATGTTSCSPTFPQATSPGNLLVCWAADHSVAGIGGGLGNGWIFPAQAAISANSNSYIFWKSVSVASDSPPVIADASASFIVARVAEFTGFWPFTPGIKGGINPGRIGQSGTVSPVATSMTQGYAPGYLFIVSNFLIRPTAGTNVFTDTLNNGVVATDQAENGSTSTVDHYDFLWGVTTSTATFDGDSCAVTGTLSELNVCTFNFEIALPVGQFTSVGHPGARQY